MRTQLVSLDVAVVDKKGRPTRAALGRDDFEITEDGKPQQLRFFEPPSTHPKAATNVFVLDDLNTSFADAQYYRYCLQKFVSAMPETLPAPAELIILNATSFKIVQPFTRSRAQFLSTLTHLPGSEMTFTGGEPDELLLKSLSALESIALENLGDAGKVNVVWLGRGSGVDTNYQSVVMRARTERFIRYLTNTLVEGRMTLYVVFPPGNAAEPTSRLGSQSNRAAELSIADPYEGNINFRTLSAETGGSAYTATNDLAAAMGKALDLGGSYYTLGYRPGETITDGRFRHIRVTLRDPNLHIITKSGYFAPEVETQDAPQTIQVFQMTEAGKSTLPFHHFELHITHIDRSLDGKTAEFTIVAEGKNFPWRPEDPDGSLAELTAGGLSLSQRGKVLSSYFRNVNLMARSQDPVVLQGTTASFKLTLAIPSDTDRVRLVVSSRNNGQLGCVDASRAAINAAPETSLPLVPGS